MAYASKTPVPIEKTRQEIEHALEKHGAKSFLYAQEGLVAIIGFRLGDYTYRFTIKVPQTPQEARSRWRALLLVIKGRLEGVASGVETIEEAFMANTVMHGGQTVAEWLGPEFKQARVEGRMPQRLMLEGRR